jgi:hypothetical protein
MGPPDICGRQDSEYAEFGQPQDFTVGPTPAVPLRPQIAESRDREIVTGEHAYPLILLKFNCG